MSSRQRKGKPTQAAPSPRGAEEVNATPSREPRSPAPRRAASALGPQVLLWVLLSVALGALAWLHLAQRDGLRELRQEVLELQTRLREQVLRGKDKLLDAAELEQRVSEQEAELRLLEQKLEKATATVEQSLATGTVGKLSALQSEVKKSLHDLREELPSSADLSQLQRQVELLQSTHLEKLSQDVASILSDSSMMKENISLLTTWQSSAAEATKETSRSLQVLHEDMGAVSDSFDVSLGFLSERVEALEGGFNQTSRAVELLQSQVERSQEDLTNLREVAASQRLDHTSDLQQLDNMREMIQQLDTEKSQTEEEVISIRRSVADQKRETQNEVSELTSALGILQARVLQVETGATNQNVKLSEAVEHELQSLRKELDKVAVGIQQCLSGEVQTYCETEEDCGWPHLREVSFPHRVLTEPTITLGVSSLSARGSVGVSVKAIDITDSGFKVQISNVGDHHLSTVRVTWMLCA